MSRLPNQQISNIEIAAVEETVQRKLKCLVKMIGETDVDLQANVDKNQEMLNNQISLSETSLPHGTLRLTLLFFVRRELTINSVSFSVMVFENLYGLKLLKMGEALPSGASSPKTKKTQNGIILYGFNKLTRACLIYIRYQC